MRGITMRLVVGRKINTTTSGYCLCNAIIARLHYNIRNNRLYLGL